MARKKREDAPEMGQLTVRMPVELLDGLKDLARAEGHMVSMQDVLRRLAEKAIRERKAGKGEK